ncbi:hypothetical protein GQ457_10G016370 [Hibiscus cannabinus]
MAAGASDGLFRSIYEGCISGCDIIIERRPYHRNCGCALHDKSRRTCPHGSPKTTNLSYPIKRVWQEGCLALDAAAAASPPSSPRFTGIHATVKQKRKEEPPSPRFTGIHATMKQQRKEDDNDDEDKYMAITAKPWK